MQHTCKLHREFPPSYCQLSAVGLRHQLLLVDTPLQHTAKSIDTLFVRYSMCSMVAPMLDARHPTAVNGDCVNTNTRFSKFIIHLGSRSLEK